ncbi:RVT_3 domain-containing protein [Cephalotus follicularis]|uniref:RVT_3 domain-containing protein n=1 Tax=Cephalotus follicularis TaxID=3775 RepID=A0A1Q3CBX2_CEPFO|nr:RVT_3 domain-containing protein [Cephalotus follicularis]
MEEDTHWKLYVDGSLSSKGNGAGLMLICPKGDTLKYMLKFYFPASNNAAEYESVLIGLIMAKHVGAKNVKVYNDSQLVISQLNGNYETSELVLARYLNKVKRLLNSS